MIEAKNPTTVANPEQDELLAGLNPNQRAAVVHGDGPLLVLAGAGSGKTRVITHRIAWLVERRSVLPWRILAVTFTNKAAGEMRERLEKLLGPAGADVQVSTFHAAGAAILRREAEKVGRTRSFVIYDDSDQMQLLRRAIADLGFADRVKPQYVRHAIDHAKNHAHLPQDLVVPGFDRVGDAVKKVYARYEQLLRANDAVDFGDLLLKLVVLLRQDRETLEKYRSRFRYVLVDEFQDTNPVQYELLRLLCPKEHANLCVVGDDDQSIYRWRGADVSNILSFERDFSGAAVVKLEQNYRSDAGILEAAYAVISKNPRRKEKRLWTDRPRGELFRLLYGPDERGEAQLVAQRIRELAAEGIPYSEMAVFYRINAQSRVLEEGLRLGGLPYHVVRGRAFYDRAEIKDAASYLRLAVNRRSDADIERVINTPARGIGETTLERLRGFAREREVSLYEALADAAQVAGLNSGAVRRLVAFRGLVDSLHDRVASAPDAHAAVEEMLKISGLVDTLTAEGTEESLERVENLREFSGAALQFDREYGERNAAGEAAAAGTVEAEAAAEAAEPGLDAGGPLRPPPNPLEAFLEQISLIGDADSDPGAGRVSLMTLHAAKGLEFDCVFMTGMEEGVFPHSRAINPGDDGLHADPEEIAEERRLCYVGITRARRRLHLSLARSRALFGELRRNEPSRFLRDVPPELFDHASTAAAAPARAPERAEREPGELYVEREPEFDLDDHDGFTVERDEFDQRAESERRPPPPAPRHRGRERFSPPVAKRRPPVPVPAVGTRVRHENFGVGLVVAASGASVNASVTVRFPGLGERRIVARFLTPVDDS